MIRRLMPLLLSVQLAAQGPAPMTVMTFNIRYGTADDGDDAWPARRDQVIETIGRISPEVLGLQEALRFQLDELGAQFPGYRELGVGRDDGAARGEYAAILVDTTRFEILASGTFWLSDTPEVPGSASWGNRIPRITTWARLRDKTGGPIVRVFNLHLDHQSQPSRERSIERVMEHVGVARNPFEAVLVMGDFNADEANPAYRIALAAGMLNAFRQAHPGTREVNTFNGFQRDVPVVVTGGMIDHILLASADWRVRQAGIDRTRSRDGRWASDHFAVWARICWQC
jgi:endonuclease/exonuclease/phosphatase family metal-dependent hydrolase